MSEQKRNAEPSLNQKIKGLEQNLGRLIVGINQKFSTIEQRLGTTEEAVEALTEIQGKEEVLALIAELRAAKAQQASDQEKTSLETAITDGYVVTAAAVEARSLIVGRYTDPQGNILPPGRAQLVVPNVQPQFASQLLGKPVGTKLTLPDGHTFELQEIYTVDEAKAAEVMAAKQEAANAAAVAAAAATAAADEATDTAPAAAPPAPPAPPAAEAQAPAADVTPPTTEAAPAAAAAPAAPAADAASATPTTTTPGA